MVKINFEIGVKKGVNPTKKKRCEIENIEEFPIENLYKAYIFL